MKRKHNTYEFFEKVKEILKRCQFEMSKDVEIIGESVGTIYTMRNDKAGLEVEVTAGSCIVTDREGNSKKFYKSQTEWERESLDYIETLLKLIGKRYVK